MLIFFIGENYILAVREQGIESMSSFNWYNFIVMNNNKNIEFINPENIKSKLLEKKLSNWPVVYFLFNKSKTKLYIGETSGYKQRFRNHAKLKPDLTEKRIVYFDDFNSSASYHLESYLIQKVLNEIKNDSKVYKNMTFAKDETLSFVNNSYQKEGINRDYFNKSIFKKRLSSVFNELSELMDWEKLHYLDWDKTKTSLEDEQKESDNLIEEVSPYEHDLFDPKQCTSELEKKASNWPVVYYLFDEEKTKLYIGETSNYIKRFRNHSIKKPLLVEQRVNYYSDFNGSVSYNMESFLIERVYTEIKNTGFEFYEEEDDDINEKILIANLGRQARGINRNYYNKHKYSDRMEEAFDELHELMEWTNDNYNNKEEIISLRDINPVKPLSQEQKELYETIVSRSENNLNTVIKASAGTGKSLLIMRLAAQMLNEYPDKTIGIFSARKGTISPFELNKNKLSEEKRYRLSITDTFNYDFASNLDFILIDEGHCIVDADKQQLSSLSGVFFKNNIKPKGKYGKEALNNEVKNVLDWLNIAKIPFAIFYDDKQSTGKAFIDSDLIEEYSKDNQIYTLSEQYRMEAGIEFEVLINEILWDGEFEDEYMINPYEISVFDSESDLYNWVITKDMKDNNARLVAPLSLVDWTNKNLNLKQAKSEDYVPEYDYEIATPSGDTHKLFWNLNWTKDDWIVKSTSQEIGSVHSVMGKSLTFVGVIIEDDLYINEEGKLDVHVDKRWSRRVDTSSEEKAKKQILNQYYTLLTRGKKGMALYAKDPKVNEYFKEALSRAKIKD